MSVHWRRTALWRNRLNLIAVVGLQSVGNPSVEIFNNVKIGIFQADAVTLGQQLYTAFVRLCLKALRTVRRHIGRVLFWSVEYDLEFEF